jgi:hypothetical protein
MKALLQPTFLFSQANEATINGIPNLGISHGTLHAASRLRFLYYYFISGESKFGCDYLIYRYTQYPTQADIKTSRRYFRVAVQAS